MHSGTNLARVAVAGLMLGAGPARAQTLERFAIESSVAASQFAGKGAADQPDIVVDVTATARLRDNWVATIRPWLRRAPTNPHTVVKEIYQATVQHVRMGRVATRVDLGYIVSPIGLGMLDMRADTNPVIMPHMSYLIPMPAFDAGVPSARPIASSYPPGGQVTASTSAWDVRGAVIATPPNRSFVLNAPSPNPRSRPFTVAGAGFTPRVGVRIGASYGFGEYATRDELARTPAIRGRSLRMGSIEGEFAAGYFKLSGEITRDRLETSTGRAVATQWFIQGVRTLTPRWFAAARHEGVSAPPQKAGGVRPLLRITEVTAGFRLSPDFTLRAGVASRRTYFDRTAVKQAGASIVWTRRWW